MKIYRAAIISLLVFLSACAGADSQTKRDFKNTANTIAFKNLSQKDFSMMEAGSQLKIALEAALSDPFAPTSFVLAHREASYVLKYKILEYQEGSRVMGVVTLGLSKASHGKLKVKAALFRKGKVVGAWVVDSWTKGAFGAGTLFKKAAHKIMGQLMGRDFDEGF
jgi:outer membrane lipoprotein-sorting protein